MTYLSWKEGGNTPNIQASGLQGYQHSLNQVERKVSGRRTRIVVTRIIELIVSARDLKQIYRQWIPGLTRNDISWWAQE